MVSSGDDGVLVAQAATVAQMRGATEHVAAEGAVRRERTTTRRARRPGVMVQAAHLFLTRAFWCSAPADLYCAASGHRHRDGDHLRLVG